MRTCTEHIVALRYKLRMFGVHIDGPAKALSDNNAVINNSSKIESTLNKNIVRWHIMQEDH